MQESRKLQWIRQAIKNDNVSKAILPKTIGAVCLFGGKIIHIMYFSRMFICHLRMSPNILLDIKLYDRYLMQNRCNKNMNQPKINTKLYKIKPKIYLEDKNIFLLWLPYYKKIDIKRKAVILIKSKDVS